MITLRFVSSSEWPALAGRFHDVGFEQSQTYTEAAASRIGGSARFVAMEQAGKLVAAACIRTKQLPILKRGIIWIAAGPLTQPLVGEAPDDATLSAIFTALRVQFTAGEGHILRLRLPGTAFHDTEKVRLAAVRAGFSDTSRAAVYRSVAMDLLKSSSQLIADMHPKWRASLRTAQKKKLSVDAGNTPALKARFLALYRNVMSVKGFNPDITPDFHFALAGRDYSLEVMIASQDGLDLAGVVIGTVGTSVTLLFAATVEAGRPLCAGYFLTWASILRAQEQGAEWFDLGGMDPEANPDVARFKSRLNGRQVLATPFEARPKGAMAGAITALESMRARVKRR